MSKINYRYLIVAFIAVIAIALFIDRFDINFSALSPKSTDTFLTTKSVNNFSYADFSLKVVNFLFVILVFFVAREDRINDQNKKDSDEEKKIHQDNNTFWFREFVIKPRRNDILNFFESVDSLCSKYSKDCENSSSNSIASHEQNIKNTIRSLNESIQKFDKSFLQELAVINEILSTEIRSEIDNLQDELSSHISSMPQNVNGTVMMEMYSKCKSAVLKKLMSFNKLNS